MKNNKQYERRRIDLHPGDWKKLEKVAKEVGATAERGVTAGMPSIATMLRLIAEGKLHVIKQ